MRHLYRLSAGLAVALVFFVPALAWAQCTPGWSEAFGFSGLTTYALRLGGYDLGAGPRLLAGGSFIAAGDVPGTASLAQWNGFSWSGFPLMPGSGPPEPKAFQVFDDGSGPALYVGFSTSFQLTNGTNIDGVARWDGASWSSAGSTSGEALAVFDDGSGPALYSGGAGGVRRWNGANWITVGGAFSGGAVYGLRVWADGSYPGLYAVGEFTNAGGTPAAHVARWDGIAWTALAGGVPGIARDAVVYDEGAGPALYVAGDFATMSWNGTAWTAVGTGAPGAGLGAGCWGLEVFDDGGGPALFVCGNNTNGIARYAAGVWSGVGGWTQSGGRDLLVFDDGGGPALYMAGLFPGVPYRGIARWNGIAWSGLSGDGADGGVYAFQSADLGAGPAFFAGGGFGMIGGIAASGVAALHQGRWAALGSGVSGGDVRSLQAFQDTNGPALYAGGTFTSAGGAPAGSIARWNGSTWGNLLGGVSGQIAPPSSGGVHAMTVFDEGSGPRLIVGGNFTMAGGVPVDHVAAWDGSSWTSMGGIPGHRIHALLVADLGSGPTLFAAGAVTPTGHGFVMQRVAGGWLVIGDSTGPGGVFVGVKALAAFDDGTGPALYAAGGFWLMYGQSASNIEKWDGVSWTSVSPVVAAGTLGVESLAVFDDGTGEALYASGSPFLGSPVIFVGRMTVPGSWTPVGGDIVVGTNTCSGVVCATVDDGSGPAVYVGGCVIRAGGIPSSHIAKWGPTRPRVELVQPGGPGSPVEVRNNWLLKSHEYYNVFSDSLCGTLGNGPYLGLCATDPAFLLTQFFMPLGSVPFHFNAPLGSMTFGGYQLPPGLWLDGVCFDYTGGVFGCVSGVTRIGVQ